MAYDYLTGNAFQAPDVQSYQKTQDLVNQGGTTSTSSTSGGGLWDTVKDLGSSVVGGIGDVFKGTANLAGTLAGGAASLVTSPLGALGLGIFGGNMLGAGARWAMSPPGSPGFLSTQMSTFLDQARLSNPSMFGPGMATRLFHNPLWQAAQGENTIEGSVYAASNAYSSDPDSVIRNMGYGQFQMYKELYMNDPKAARMFLIQQMMNNLRQLSEMLTNMAKTQHEIGMAFARNMRA